MNDKSFDLDYDFNRKFDFRFREVLDDGYVATSANIGDIAIEANVIASTQPNQNINILPNGSGQVLVNADPVNPLGIATKQYVDMLSINHNFTSANISDFNTAVDNRITIQKSINNGLATLDASGKVPMDQLPFSGTIYKGTWDATNNNPTITSGQGNQGWFYIVAVAGSTTIDGINSWNVGDWIIFDGIIWQKSQSTNLVSSVAGKIGVVVLTASDITSGQFANSLISLSSIVQYQSQMDIRAFMNAPLGIVVGTTDVQTLTYKTIDARYNTISNIGDSAITTNAGINASKLSSGIVNNTMFDYLSGATSNIQNQLNNKSNVGHTHDASDIISGQFSSSLISQASVVQYQSAININRLTGAPVSLVVGISDVQTLTNKTIDANSNTILNIGNNQLSSGISLAKIGSGNVTSAQFDCLIGINSRIQNQLDGKSNINHTHLWADVTNISTIVPQSNFNGNGPPNFANDSTQGYQLGSRWIDATNQQEWVCLNTTPNNAVWTETTTVGGAGGGVTVKYQGNNIPGTPNVALDFYAPSGGIVLSNLGNGIAKLNVLATINDTDANLRNRQTHTGTQLSDTISDFDIAVTDSTHANRYDNPHHVTAAQLGLSNVQNIQDNNTATREPLPSDDVTQGYSVGSRWINISVLQASNCIFYCMDNTQNFAVWIRVLSQPIYYQQPLISNVSSSDNNPTVLLDVSTITNKAYYLQAKVVARRTDATGEVGAYILNCLYINADGVLTKTADDKLEMETDWPWTISSSISGTDIQILGTGEAGKQILWRVVCEINMV